MQPQYHKQDGPTAPGAQPHAAAPATTPNGTVGTLNADAIDDLIANATKQADAGTSTTQLAPVTKGETPTERASTPVPKRSTAEDSKDAKKDGKDKAKPTRLVYSDNDTSPEEKMAMLPRYAFSKPVAA